MDKKEIKNYQIAGVTDAGILDIQALEKKLSNENNEDVILIAYSRDNSQFI